MLPPDRAVFLASQIEVPTIADIEVTWVDRAFWIIPRMTALNLMAAGMLLGWYGRLMPQWALMAWAAVTVVFVLARALVIRLLWRWRRNPERKAEQTYKLWSRLSLVTGLYWGASACLLYPHGGALENLILGLVLYGLSVVSSYHLSTRYRGYLAYFVCAIVPFVVQVAWPGEPQRLWAAACVSAVIGTGVWLARRYLTYLQDFGEEMLTQFREEKAAADSSRRAADAARREAELANQAKTQFFAAASHDLRQPLHAMGLLAEALTQRRLDPELAPLVGSINDAVDALEDLFSELLDITKIDSGGVVVEPEHVDVSEMFRKLRVHFEPVAFDKGLSLRFRGDGNALYADPVLVERIVRNLLSNALRYTHDGGVLVGCRRRGERVEIQVWDTGVGIKEEQRSRIFDEFFQVGDAPGSQASRRRGLGLGLSIAQRMARLMGTSVQLRSVPGMGSVFSLSLPAGDLTLATGARPSTPLTPPLHSLHGRSIMVIDDEPTVRAGLEALVGGWGAKVQSFDGAYAVEGWLGRERAASDRPDVVIVDYQLGGEVTGLDLVDQLRQRFGGHVPAIMVTGSLTPQLDASARERGFPVMLKPVAPHKLRALVDHALSSRVGGVSAQTTPQLVAEGS